MNGVAPGCILWLEESWDKLSVEERQARMKENKKQEDSVSVKCRLVGKESLKMLLMLSYY